MYSCSTGLQTEVRIRILDIKNSNPWYQQFGINVNSACSCWTSSSTVLRSHSHYPTSDVLQYVQNSRNCCFKNSGICKSPEYPLSGIPELQSLISKTTRPCALQYVMYYQCCGTTSCSHNGVNRSESKMTHNVPSSSPGGNTGAKSIPYRLRLHLVFTCSF